MKFIVLAGMLLVSATLMSCEKDDDNENGNSVNDTDQSFVTGAAISNTAEIQAGQLAILKATDPAIKAYGQLMVSEHTLAQTDLKFIGSRIGVAVADTVDAQHRALAQLLTTLNGRAFDSAYINSQVTDHQNTENLFLAELDDGNNDSLQSYANKYLPHIQMHLHVADSLAVDY